MITACINPLGLLRLSPKKDTSYHKHCSFLVPQMKFTQAVTPFEVEKAGFYLSGGACCCFCCVPVLPVLFLNRNFVEEKLGAKYVERTRLDLSKAFEESSPSTPVFFILSPGVNALKDLEVLGE